MNRGHGKEEESKKLIDFHFMEAYVRFFGQITDQADCFVDFLSINLFQLLRKLACMIIGKAD